MCQETTLEVLKPSFIGGKNSFNKLMCKKTWVQDFFWIVLNRIFSHDILTKINLLTGNSYYYLC